MQDAFYDYAMKGAKGSKMPRGDKEQIMRYEIPTFSLEQRKNIGKFIVDIDSKIAINRAINDNLPTPDHSSAEAATRLVA
jgi:type I restriction enzyme S subunit